MLHYCTFFIINFKNQSSENYKTSHIDCIFVSDDETETQEEQVCRNEWDCNSEAEFEPRQQVVGMKRHIDTESWSYYV